MNNIETMRLALEALETLNSGDTYKTHNAATALRQAIEQAQQAEPTSGDYALGYSIGFGEGHSAKEAIEQAEPDYYGLTKDHLWMSITKDHYDMLKPEFRMACYTSPPPRQWVGLTDEEIETVWDSGVRAFHLLARELETKLKEKNT
jgi:hypothetical protein